MKPDQAVHIKTMLLRALPDAKAAATQARTTQNLAAITAELERGDDFALFQTCGDNELIRMRHAAAQFLADMLTGQPARWLTLVGPCGTGKTYLASLISVAVAKRKLVVSETLEFGFFLPGIERKQWEVALERSLQTRRWGWVEDLCNARYAEIDDIASEFVPQEISTPKLALLAQRRLNKWTVFTANLSLENIKTRLDARIASRMIRNGNVVVDVDTIDFNLR